MIYRKRKLMLKITFAMAILMSATAYLFIANVRLKKQLKMETCRYLALKDYVELHYNKYHDKWGLRNFFLIADDLAVLKYENMPEWRR